MTMTYNVEESKSSIIEFMAELIVLNKFGDKLVVLGQLRWVLEASDQSTRNHGVYRSADHTLEQMR